MGFVEKHEPKPTFPQLLEAIVNFENPNMPFDKTEEAWNELYALIEGFSSEGLSSSDQELLDELKGLVNDSTGDVLPEVKMRYYEKMEELIKQRNVQSREGSEKEKE